MWNGATEIQQLMPIFDLPYLGISCMSMSDDRDPERKSLPNAKWYIQVAGIENVHREIRCQCMGVGS